MLLCTKCDTDKDEDEFYVDRARPHRNGRTYWCKKCYADNYADNRERQKFSNQRARIKRRYGLEWDEYQRLLAIGCCICGAQDCKLHVDHCHETGVTRGILCLNCNTLLGHSGDSPERLRAAAVWLESNPMIGQGLPGQAY